MHTEQLIRLDAFCGLHNVEFSFIHSLHEYGLIEITTKEDAEFIPESGLKQVEQLVRLYRDLNLNLEGVEVITYLLEQLKEQHQEITRLQNKLRFYEL